MRRLPAGFAALLLVGCNAILGIEDRPLRPDAGGHSHVDAGANDADALSDSTVDVLDGAQDGNAGSPYAAAVLADAPVLYLRFGEQAGATATDERHRFDATYPSVGVMLRQPGALLNDSNTAVAFDGANGKIQVPQGADFQGLVAFSVEVWLNRRDATGLGFVVDHESWEGGRTGWDLLGSFDGTSLERYESASNDIVAHASPIDVGTWHHVVGTWDGIIVRVFVDGVLAASTGTSNVALGVVPGTWTVGGQNCSCSGTFYSGLMDELAVYDTALTEERIVAHYHASGR